MEKNKPDKITHCEKCGYIFFRKIDKTNFECEYCKHINIILTM